MKIFCTASADSYITDKIIDGNFRAEDANVGKIRDLKRRNEELESGFYWKVQEMKELAKELEKERTSRETREEIDIRNLKNASKEEICW